MNETLVETPVEPTVPVVPTPRVVASAAEIPVTLARDAFRGTSFVPDKRGDSIREEYAAILNSDHADLLRMANTPERVALLDEEFARYKSGYRRHFIAYLVSRSRVMSSMITGPSNFPTRSNRKKMDTSDRRSEDLSSYRERALKAIRRNLRPDLGPVKMADPDAVPTLKAKLAEREADQARMKAVNAHIRKRATWTDGALKFKKGVTEDMVIVELTILGLSHKAAREVLRPSHCTRFGFATYSLTNNNANIVRIRERIASLEKMKSSEEAEVTYTGGVVLRSNPTAARVQIEFPGKPNEGTRDKLKHAGFRWSPTEGAWQRHLNNNGIYAAKNVLRELGLEPERTEPAEVEETEPPAEDDAGDRDEAEVLVAAD